MSGYVNGVGDPNFDMFAGFQSTAYVNSGPLVPRPQDIDSAYDNNGYYTNVGNSSESHASESENEEENEGREDDPEEISSAATLSTSSSIDSMPVNTVGIVVTSTIMGMAMIMVAMVFSASYNSYT